MTILTINTARWYQNVDSDDNKIDDGDMCYNTCRPIVKYYNNKKNTIDKQVKELVCYSNIAFCVPQKL